MTRRNVAAALIAVLAALGCARLGWWQLERHSERQAYNEEVTQRRMAESLPVQQIRGEEETRYRRVEAEGVFDYEREFVLTGRSLRGSPGVHVMTPLLLPGESRAVLVNRGWLYSADAARVDLGSWRDADSARVIGYVEELPPAGESSERGELAPGVWYRLDRAALERRLPYALEDMQLVAVEIAPSGEQVPVRLGLPAVEDGPHLSYAFQWFAFGMIALIGGAALIFQDIRGRR